MLFHSCQKDVRQSYYSLASTFMRWLLEDSYKSYENTLQNMSQIAISLAIREAHNCISRQVITKQTHF